MAWNAAGSGLLAEYLKAPDDLTKISSLRRKLTREHAALSAKLKIGAKDQLEATREGLLQLQSTRREVAGVQGVFSRIEGMFIEPGAGGYGSETRAARSFRIVTEVRFSTRSGSDMYSCRSCAAHSYRRLKLSLIHI